MAKDTFRQFDAHPRCRVFAAGHVFLVAAVGCRICTPDTKTVRYSASADDNFQERFLL